jgi:uncharacterized protein
MTNFARCGSAFAVCLLATSVLLAQSSLPKPSGYVNDLAGILDAGTRSTLEQRLKDVEAKTSSEIAVATVPSLDGMSIEEYATHLFKEWGVGQATTDNGVLVLVAPNDREMRIEVGYGLEGVLPDGLAGQIRDEQFLPRFRDNDYVGGIAAGVNRIADIVEKNQVLTPEELARLNTPRPQWAMVPFLGIFVFIGSFMVGLGLRTKAVFPILFGGFFSGMPMAMAVLVTAKTALFALGPLWLLVASFGYWLGGRDKWKDAFRPGKSSGKSGWVMGGGSGGSGRSGSSGGSSSFGGGRSGGGGASGRW